MINDLKAIAVFAETAKHGSFRAAATTLGLSPSVVSYQISQLEARLGTALLYRSTRKLTLTSEGESLYKQAQLMVSAAKTGIEQVSGKTETPSGHLKIALAAVLARAPVNQQIAEFHKAYPDIELSIHFSDSRDDLIAEGFDLALRVGAMEDSSLKAKKVAQIFRKLVAAPSLFEAIAYPKSPDELKKFSWVQLNQLSRKRTITHVSGEKQTLETSGKLCVDNVEAMCQFCVAGLGLATPPDYLVEHYIKDRTLVELLPDWQVEPIPVYAVWPQNISDSSNAKRLINFLN